MFWSISSGTDGFLIFFLGGLVSSGLGNGLSILVLVDDPIEDIVILNPSRTKRSRKILRR